MIHQPPAGARDLFPLDVAQKHWIEERLQQIFHRWGYHRVITSTLERLDTLMAGGAVQRSTVIQLHDTDNEVLGLRPELTASIARAAVTRLDSLSLPQRLYYNANVFRRSAKGSSDRQYEFYQAGVELIGAQGTVADGEVLLLLMDCIQNLKLADWHLVLGNAELTRSLLSPFPSEWRDRVRQGIAHLDRITLETLPLSPELRSRALAMFDLRGTPAQVFPRLAQLELDESQWAAVENLKTLVELLEKTCALQSLALPSLVLDLSLIQTFDYYTGIVFEVVTATPTGYRTIGQGGRYDQLLELFHPQGTGAPGIGFVLNIEELHQALLPTGQLPVTTPVNSWLVVPQSAAAQAAAFAYAQTIRDSTTLVRVEVSLGDRTPEQTRSYARQRGIAQIAWVNGAGVTEIEAVR
ncbi:MAG: ATP phosphoribosyltransferase regulatory subunit [Synechococcales bacterium]|nr:ATP phosphoribosyltransferase regulatory subunit [Synechococcales bacterium]